MNPTISVRTTQNVYIQYPLGSLGDRIVAYLIDSVIQFAYIFLLYQALENWFDVILEPWVRICLFAIPFLLYHLVFELLMDGQSPGKKIMRIKVIRLDGSSSTLGNYLLRWMFRLVEILVLRGALAIITIASSSKGQRLGDIVGGTAIIKLPKEDQIQMESVFTLAGDDYVPMFPQAANLSDKDVEILQSALDYFRETGDYTPTTILLEKLNTIFGIQSDLSTTEIFTTVIKDHAALNTAKA